MNERIDELMIQAGARFEFLHGVHYDDFQYREFARLIVQECAKVNYNAIESMNKISGKESDNTAFWLEEALKEHFGVEE